MKNATIRKVLASVESNKNTSGIEGVKGFKVSFLKNKIGKDFINSLMGKYYHDVAFEIIDTGDIVTIAAREPVWVEIYKMLTNTTVNHAVSEGALEILFAGLITEAKKIYWH